MKMVRRYHVGIASVLKRPDENAHAFWCGRVHLDERGVPGESVLVEKGSGFFGVTVLLVNVRFSDKTDLCRRG